MKEKAIIEEEKIKVAKLAEIEKEKMKEEIQMMLEEERVKAKEEKEALRAQMMSQASEIEERERTKLEEERVKAREEKEALRAQMMSQASEIEERERTKLEEERVKAREEKEALRAQMMSQASEIEERERTKLEEERVKAREEKEALRAQMMSQASESEEQRVKASLEMERILDDLRIQVTQLHFERNMASVCDFPSTFLRHVEDVSSTEVRVVYSSTPHRGISNSPKWRSNNDVSRIRCDIESSSVAGDWTNRISLESSPGVSEMEDTEPLTPLYSHTPLEFSPRNQLIGDNSRNQSPGSRSITGASNNFSDLDTNGDRCSYER